jgi:stage II sporulation protein D
MTAALLLAAALSAEPSPRPLVTWRLEDGRVRSEAGAPAGPRPVGSLVKPFLAEAWARAHPGTTPPRFRCDRSSPCWKPAGHGELALARALAVSCNAYFRALAADTPPDALARVLREEGFRIGGPLSPEAALGLSDEEAAATIEPARLLEAYARLVTQPWPVQEPVRREVLEGLREAAGLGTARLAGGVMGKTGTVRSLDGRALSTSGWALSIDEGGRATLGLLARGTGREAAKALGALQRRGSTASSDAHPVESDSRVSVLMLSAFAPRVVQARVAAAVPAPSSRGFLGPGTTISLGPGDRLSDSLWELALPGRSFVRRVRGRIAVEATASGTLRLEAEVTRREYAAGILLAELPEGDPDRRGELAAAALRFVAQGPRHGAADVCDTTHCAWFLARGPRVSWTTPAMPVLLREPRPVADDVSPIDTATWARVEARAEEAGPMQWSSHCGGEPLSAHFVWGNGDRRVWACPRHTRPAAPWTRDWPAAALVRAFGSPVRQMAVTERDGVWTLEVTTAAGTEGARFDDVHRRLAEVLGQDALPSPARRVMRITDGFRAEGLGRGHRVGLCLAD